MADNMVTHDGLPNGVPDTRERKPSNASVIIHEEPNEKKFVDNFSSDEQLPWEYPKSNANPGKIVIFNFMEFIEIKRPEGKATKPATRYGTTEDVKELVSTFRRLKYNVDTEDIHNDLTEKEVTATLESIVSSIGPNSVNSLICIFLSHGTDNEKIVVKDGVMSMMEIYKPFSDCANLEGVPKLFIIQACKSSDTEKVQKVGEETTKKPKMLSHTILSNGLNKDVLIAYATVEGEPSNRNTEEGTWFIQELCMNMRQYGDREDIIGILTRTIKFVVANYHNKNKRQVPMIVSTLRKQFYLNLSRPRRELLQLHRNLSNQ